MQTSPIQLKDLYYKNLVILLENEEDTSWEPREFNFDGVMIREFMDLKKFDHPDKDTSYVVALRIAIQNQEGKLCPYCIDMEVVGHFEILSENIAIEKREEFAIINGCAMLYGAIREQVMNFTSRCARGTLILPTINFLDKIKKEESAQEQDHEEQSKQAEMKPKRRKRTTKPKDS